jgi:malonate transporter and related proteins
MFEIFSLLLPVFAIIALGRAAVMAKLLDTSAVKSLNDFALWIALPALLFRSLAEVESLHIVDVAGVYLVGCLVVYVTAGLTARFLLRRSSGEAVMFALNATYGNIIYLGTPIISMAFGPSGIAVLVGIIALHSGVLLPITSVLFELSRYRRGNGFVKIAANTAKSLLRNPMLMSIVVGIA